jgi:hypothetical protein
VLPDAIVVTDPWPPELPPPLPPIVVDDETVVDVVDEDEDEITNVTDLLAAPH